MMKKINILCAMRDARVAEELSRELDDGERCAMRIVGNGDAVITSVRRFVPDILVLDAILPHLDGLGVVDRLRVMLGGQMPRIIGGSMMPFSDAGFQRRGVSCLVRVPWEHDQLKKAILDQICEIESCVDWQRAQPSYERACFLLRQLGMRSKLQGFTYLAWAAALAYESEARLFAVGERLYRPIAARFDTTPQNVERLIRHAVESTVDSVGAVALYGFFGNTIDPTRGKPTNAQMTGMLVQRMRVS